MGGAEKVLLDIVKTQKKKYGIHVLAFKDIGPLKEEMHDNCKIITLFTSGLHYLVFRKIRVYRKYLINKIVHNNKYDVVVGFMEGKSTDLVADIDVNVCKIGWVHNDFRKLDILVNEREMYNTYSAMDKIVCVSKDAKKVFISFPETKKYIKNRKIVFTGLPVREIDIESDCSKLLRKMELDKEKPIFLAFGGSQGSHVLLKMLKEVEKEIQKMGLQGIIVKGNVKLTFKYAFPHVLKEYIYDMPSFYKISDFVIARGGASTIWELINARKPAIIIPIKGNLHQLKNALFFKELGGGYVVEEEDIQSFINSISYLLDKKEEFIKNLKSFNIPDWRVILNKEMKNA